MMVQHKIQPLCQEYQASHNQMIQKQVQLSSMIELLQEHLTQIMKFFKKSSPQWQGMTTHKWPFPQPTQPSRAP